MAIGIVIAMSMPAHAQNSLSSDSLSPGTTLELRYEGFTAPKEDIMLAANELGRIESIDVNIGDTVRPGQVIGKLEDKMQQMAVEFAAAQVAMTGELDAAKAEMDLSRSRTEQLRELFANQAARPDELARAETDLRISTARYQAAVEQNQLRQLELKRFKLQLERRHVRAPKWGVITEVFRHSGEYITPADPAIVQLMVVDKLIAIFDVPVEDVAAVREGQLVRLFFRSKAISLEAPVTSVAPNITADAGTVQVRVELDNTERKLLAGDHFAATILPGKVAVPTQPTEGPAKAAAFLPNPATKQDLKLKGFGQQR